LAKANYQGNNFDGEFGNFDQGFYEGGCGNQNFGSGGNQGYWRQYNNNYYRRGYNGGRGRGRNKFTPKNDRISDGQKDAALGSDNGSEKDLGTGTSLAALTARCWTAGCLCTGASGSDTVGAKSKKTGQDLLFLL
jgi:hypothetical protein